MKNFDTLRTSLYYKIHVDGRITNGQYFGINLQLQFVSGDTNHTN
jgi:hypothetical protein